MAKVRFISREELKKEDRYTASFKWRRAVKVIVFLWVIQTAATIYYITK